MRLQALAVGLLLVASCKNRGETSTALAQGSRSSFAKIAPSGNCPRSTPGPSQFSAVEVLGATQNSDGIFIVEISAAVQASSSVETYKGYATEENARLAPQNFRLKLDSSRASFTIFVRNGRITGVRASGGSTVGGFNCQPS